MSDQFRFWMVYGVGRGAPTYQHVTKESAVTEAKRLAGNCPGETFVVLVSTDAFRADISPVARVPVVKRPPRPNEDLDDGIPF